MSNEARWFAVGNEATGFIALGNVATGFIAFGNLARGFIAVGNLAVGVIAFGNVGCGVLFGGGATVGIGLGAVAGVLAVPVLGGAGGVITTTDLTPLLGVLPLMLWFFLSTVLRGEKPLKPELPALGKRAWLDEGRESEVWLRVRVLSSQDGAVLVRHAGRTLTLRSADSMTLLTDRIAIGSVQALVRVTRTEEIAGGQTGYRDAPDRVMVYRCLEARPLPPPVRLWSSPHYLQWALAWSWRAGACAGLPLWIMLLLSPLV